MLTIEPFVHRCMIQHGDLAGNEHEQDVDHLDVEFSNTCENCGQPLATVEQITLHIYAQLTS